MCGKKDLVKALSMIQTMKDSKGRPTRKALALKAWGFGSVEAASNFCKRHKKS